MGGAGANPRRAILSAVARGRYLARVRYRNAEDRLNPIAPAGVDDTTLGGYVAVHGRAPAFDGSDGEPYTPAIEVDPPEDGSGWGAYLVFVRWARTGTAIMGHLETPDLAVADSEQAARSMLEAMPLADVKRVLDETIERKRRETGE